MVRKHLNPRLDVSTILVTMYDGRTRLASGVAEEVREHFGDQVLKSTIPRSVRVSEAPSYGQTVMTYDPGSPGALCYLEAAREIATKGVTCMNAPKAPAASRPRPRPRFADPDAPRPPTRPTARRARRPSAGDSYADGTDGQARRRCRSRPRRWAAPSSPSCRSTSIRPNAVQPRQVFDEDAMAELVHSIREVGLLQPVVVRRSGRRGPTSWSWASGAGGPPRRPASSDPGDRPGDRRRRHAARRAAGEPAPLPAEPAGGGRGLRAAARGLRLHPRRAGVADRPVPAADQQHAAAAQALPGGPAPGGGRRAVGRARAGAAGRRGRRPPGPAGAAGGRRGDQRARSRGDRRRRRARPRHGPGASGASRPPRASPTWPSGSRTGWRPGSRSTWGGPRARSPSSSPPWRTCSGSST